MSHARLTTQIRALQADGGGVFSPPRIAETVQFDGGTIRRNRAAQLMTTQ
ncbi:hypothetical protein [Salinisphaera aquimarina]|uniref:Transposase n=1 Tax=Salinisphaera aquimarina TaxID=2094031 RepID=A0ABV7ERS7_9GAMM